MAPRSPVRASRSDSSSAAAPGGVFTDAAFGADPAFVPERRVGGGAGRLRERRASLPACAPAAAVELDACCCAMVASERFAHCLRASTSSAR